jgi:DNA-directed RNA polymerase specialized sigma24 family protein
MASEGLAETVEELRERVVPELQPLLDALIKTPDSAAEDVWRRIVEEALSEA